MSPETVDDPVGEWRDRILEGSMKLADGCSAEDLAEEFGDVDDGWADELCSEAAMIAIQEGRSKIPIEDFQAAAEQLDGAKGDGGNETDTTDQQLSSNEIPSADEVSIPSSVDPDAPPNSESDNSDGSNSSESSADEQPVNQPCDQDHTASAGDQPVSDDRVAELEAEVERLREQVDTLQTVANRDVAIIKGALRNLLGVDDLDDLSELLGPAEQKGVAWSETADRVDELQGQVQAIQDIGSASTTKEEKIAQVVSYAQGAASDGEDRVTVTVKNVKGVAGVSRRYAYDLAEDMIDDYDWALDPQEQNLRPDEEQRQKGVIVDLELLHEDAEAVNKFTTRSSGNGGD